MEAGFEASLYPADTEYTEITATTIRQWFNFTLPAKGPNMVRSGGTGIGKRAKTVRANRSQSTAPEPMPPQGRWTGSKPPLVFRPFRYPHQNMMLTTSSFYYRQGGCLCETHTVSGASNRVILKHFHF